MHRNITTYFTSSHQYLICRAVGVSTGDPIHSLGTKQIQSKPLQAFGNFNNSNDKCSAGMQPW